MVSRGVLECYVLCCNHGAMWGVLMPCGRDMTSVVLINFIIFFSFLFLFLFNLNMYLKNVHVN